MKTQSMLDTLRRSVGRMSPGDRLPPIRALMRQHKAAQVTVERCLTHLEAEGVIERRPRSGIYVLDRAPASPRQPESPTSIEVYGLVLPFVDDPLYAPLIGRFTAAAQSTFHEVVVSSTNGSTDRQGDVLMGLLEKRVAGVVVLPVPRIPSPPHQFRLLQRSNVPVVLLHRGVEGVAAPVLRLPAHQIGAKAADVLIERGHRRIAALVVQNEVSDAYVAGIHAALARVGGAYSPVLNDWTEGPSVPADYEAPMREALQRMLALPPAERPTGFFVPNDFWAESAYVILQELGMTVGDDVSIVCLGGAWRESIIRSRLTAITLDGTWAAERAIELIEQMRSGNRSPFDATVLDIPLGLHEGSTVGPAAPLETV